MTELVSFTEDLVKSVVHEKDMVKVQNFEDEENNIILEIIVQSDDMGVVIGRGGKMINAIRTLVQAAAYNKGMNKVKINVDSF